MCNLAGSRVVVTRAIHQAEELAAPLSKFGAEVLLAPMIEIAAPADIAPLREAAAQCDQYDWIIFSSVNAVNALAAELSFPRPACAPVAAIGEATRRAAQASGFSVQLMPEKYVAESLIEAFGSEDLAGKRVLIPNAAVTRDLIPSALRKLGAQVEVVEAYRNAIPSSAAERAAEVFSEPLPDWVTFASSSAVDHTVEIVGVGPLRRIKIASIGPITSQTVQKHGLDVAAEGKVHTAEGLVAAICEC